MRNSILLCASIKLRKQPIDDVDFYAKASVLRSEIQSAMDHPAVRLGIRRIQDIFRKNQGRLYHWAEDRNIPADNNAAERDLRPSVIARKVSYGSVSDTGANTRSILQTSLVTLRKRGFDAKHQVAMALDELARDPTLDAYSLLFSLHCERNPPDDVVQ